MFSEKKEPAIGPGTVVGGNVRLSGVLKDTNDITIHGSVEGEIVSDKNVAVEKNAQIKGPVTAQTIVVAGKINGEVKALEKMEILETGRVTGSIYAKNLIIKSGAQFNGKCKMGEIQSKTEIKKPIISKIDNAKKIDDKDSEKKLDDKPAKKYELE